MAAVPVFMCILVRSIISCRARPAGMRGSSPVLRMHTCTLHESFSLPLCAKHTPVYGASCLHQSAPASRQFQHESMLVYLQRPVGHNHVQAHACNSKG